MFCGVLVLRGVATADVAAAQTHAQVDLGVAGLHAVLTDVFGWPGDSDFVQMCTVAMHCNVLILPGAQIYAAQNMVMQGPPGK
jgi:hypothetical protein